MDSEGIKKEIDERIKRLAPKDESVPTKLYQIKKEVEEIDKLNEAYLIALKEERQSALKDNYDYKQHGFRKVLHRALTRNSPEVSPIVVIIALSIFILAIMSGFTNA